MPTKLSLVVTSLAISNTELKFVLKIFFKRRHNNLSRFKLKQEGLWCDVDLQNTSILEIYFPVDSLIIKPIINDDTSISDLKYKTDIVIDPTPESTAQLLALAVDHIDTLLEDWYPTLGTRFVHTSEGKFLVTRLIPCPKCLSLSVEMEQHLINFPMDNLKPNFDQFNQDESESAFNNYKKVRKSQESYTSECDSGVGPDSTGSSRMPSVEGHPSLNTDENALPGQVFYCWMVEECILAAYGIKAVLCPTHGNIVLSQIAPDTVI